MTWLADEGHVHRTATSADPGVNGPLTLRAETFYNTTSNLGTVGGKFSVQTAHGHAVLASGRCGSTAGQAVERA
jgi:hypothetical protein